MDTPDRPLEIDPALLAKLTPESREQMGAVVGFLIEQLDTQLTKSVEPGATAEIPVLINQLRRVARLAGGISALEQLRLQITNPQAEQE